MACETAGGRVSPLESEYWKTYAFNVQICAIRFEMVKVFDLFLDELSLGGN